MRLDITDRTSVKHFASAVENEFGGVTILVNNAGNLLTAGACILDCIELGTLESIAAPEHTICSSVHNLDVSTLQQGSAAC